MTNPVSDKWIDDDHFTLPDGRSLERDGDGARCPDCHLAYAWNWRTVIGQSLKLYCPRCRNDHLVGLVIRER
jgi:hypothetical protein